MSKKRKWNDDYVCFGFTCIGKTEDLQKTQCVFCENVFSNTNLKPSQLQHVDILWTMMKNICKQTERVLILEQSFQNRFYIC